MSAGGWALTVSDADRDGNVKDRNPPADGSDYWVRVGANALVVPEAAEAVARLPNADTIEGRG